MLVAGALYSQWSLSYSGKVRGALTGISQLAPLCQARAIGIPFVSQYFWEISGCWGSPAFASIRQNFGTLLFRNASNAFI